LTDDHDIVRDPAPVRYEDARPPVSNGHLLDDADEFVLEEGRQPQFGVYGRPALDATLDMPPVVEHHVDDPRRQPGLGDRASTASELIAQNISAWFGSNNVLRNVSLDMRKQSVTALIGPSGCGKSTFLRILNRMHELIPGASLAGRVMLDGQDIYDASQRPTDTRRRIGMVFQKPNPFPAMTIYDNVLAGPKLTRTPIDDKDALVEESLRRAGLWNEVRARLREPGGALSGGQQQRLCIARSLAIRPQVLLMDEPCSALDPTSTRRIEETIDEISYDVTIVIVTHNMQQAQRVSQRCAFFLAGENEPGRIVEEGATEEIFSTPKEKETADYVMGRFG
jgi:phosphate transport system ATP-binding protein